jgi:hypothetical protein
MNHATPAGAVNPPHTARPCEISGSRMGELLDAGHATLLSAQPRYSMFVRYADSWWVANGDRYCQITDSEHSRKLSRWHHRLTEGALWA